ncbi:hypothetical protein DBR00_17910 [Pseudomonas sp. HMWF032]|uniref:DUF418 domain-containing protein n=1 Tax=Pseudomonas sp. HMWF032 TaxID=2056866 RepID=UPI000D355FD2|nr:DUF418 domain-containing protein [Pseudomonas sp. HMWF032]PTS82000.1 hypothetical protein DBR00_17910 [Pseudomonas sp. HMWF032]PTT82059.1 hypothetical protein DBR41_15215 [Pseudomonas sp. HMWF010]
MEQSNRLLNIDALRGFALLGILAVNIWAFADPYYTTTQSNPVYVSGVDQAVRFSISLFFETKFYLLFSFLFGYSFTLQMASAERAERAFFPRMLRRQSGLLAIGLVHGACLYYGEILSIYALLGLILLACRGFPPGRAAKIGVVLVVTMGVLWILLGIAAMTQAAVMDADLTSANAKRAAFTGDAMATLNYHATHLLETIATLFMLQGPSAMAMFFFGLAAGRIRFFENPALYNMHTQRIFLVALPIGIVGALTYALATTYAPGGAYEIIAFGLGQLTAPLLTASYVVAAVMLFRTKPGQRIEQALAPMGKMALTNYLGQSLLLGILFTGYGFGLIDRLSPLIVLVIVPFVFAIQLLFSRWWLKHHLYGPGEWVLRAITIAAIPAWRRN